MKYQLSTTCRLGNRKTNQDRFAVVETSHGVMMVVADGMSGHSDGKLAADTLVESVVRSFNSTTFPHPLPQKFFQQILAIAHQEVLDAGAKQSPPVSPRTTCVLCLVQQGTATWAHVGDSRLYWIRHGKVLKQSRDHSRVEQMYQQGLISAEQKEKHPQRNIVTQCIGSPNKPPKPTISRTVSLNPDDVLLLCSDGLWGQLPAQQIASSFQRYNVDFALEKLAHDAEANGFPKSDNISGVAFRWLSNAKFQPPHEGPSLKDVEDLDHLADGLDDITRTLDNIEKDIH
ncbi:PP2C family protein-serine/threonine phosphatase [Kaarinaea lacus]